MYSQGGVGLEDQSMGSLSLSENGSGGKTLITEKPDYFKREFGHTDIDKSHVETFKEKFKQFLKEATKN